MATTAQIIEAGNASETSVNFYGTTHLNISEHSHLHFLRRENLKFYQEWKCVLRFEVQRVLSTLFAVCALVCFGAYLLQI